MSQKVNLIEADRPIKTFYLAGNGISSTSSKPIADAMARSASHMEALWLKMNPVKTGAFHFGRLVATHRKLELLDLFNTGLCDAGMHAFTQGLEEGVFANGGASSAPPLKHLYLSVNALTPAAIPHIITAVSLLPNLESLYLGENHFGDEGAIALLSGLPTISNLQRFEMGSSGITDTTLPAMINFVANHGGHLRSLALGSYKSTGYFKLKANKFGNVEALVALAQAGGASLVHLSLNQCMTSDKAGAAVVAKVAAASPHCHVDAVGKGRSEEQLTTTYVSAAAAATAKAALAAASHPPQLADIQSIYRNKM
jgi:Ran GTPase-activating protein (RanGAP) involved in mRNA processing and transport